MLSPGSVRPSTAIYGTMSACERTVDIPDGIYRLLVLVVAVAGDTGLRAAGGGSGAGRAGQTCTAITQANADASAGTVNINHSGTPIAGTPAPDISRGFSGIPRSAQPRLTASQQRILECTHRLAEANADIPYTLFVPSTYDPQKPAPLVVDRTA